MNRKELLDAISQKFQESLQDIGATNGEIIKAIFSNIKITRIQANCVVIQIHEPFYVSCIFNLNWWNAPYKEAQG